MTELVYGGDPIASNSHSSAQRLTRYRLTRGVGRRSRSGLLLAAIVPLAVVATVASFAAVQHPGLNRALVAVVIGGCIAAAAIRAPGFAVLLTLGFLVFLGFLRRFLIPVSDWTSYDPLLLVAPLAGGVLLVRLFATDRRHLAGSPLAKLVIALLLLTVLEAFNPTLGRLLSGLAALLFLAVPLVWFFIGRMLPDRTQMAPLLWTVVGCGVSAALYGLVQALAGLLPWDAAWVQVAGYSSLRVQGVVRPFGTFASSAEFASYVAIALVVVLALVLRGRRLALLAAPILVWALVLDSTRTAVVLALLAAVVLLGLQLRTTVGAAAAILAGAVAVVGTVVALGPTLESATATTGNPLLVRQVAGILHPLDPGRSTLGLYAGTLAAGVKVALTDPIGIGTAATNSMGAKVAAPAMVTETDIGNAFVTLGLLGGALLLAVVGMAIWTAVRLYWRSRDPVVLAVIGVLIVTLGQWLNGAHYAVAPLVWFMVGWIDRKRADGRAG